MDNTPTMLKAIINGQSSMKEELLKRIDKLGKELTDFRAENKLEHQKMNQRIDKLGEQIAYLEDNAQTREEFDQLSGVIDKIKIKIASV